MEAERTEETRTQFGQVRIAGDVVSIIIGIALADCGGIYAPERRKGKKNLTRGITVQMDKNEVICTIELTVFYGVRIPALAEEIQSKIHNTVENMTGLTVKEVNLRILAVRSEKQEEAKESEI